MITGKTQIKEVLYMDKGIVQVICGDGVGKTSMALGKGIGAITKNKSIKPGVIRMAEASGT